jgi:hypothetical protein
MNHPEPWKIVGKELCDAKGSEIIRIEDDGMGEGDNCPHFWAEVDQADMERIVACVNFCRQFPTKSLTGRQMLYMPDGAYTLPPMAVLIAVVPNEKENP